MECGSKATRSRAFMILALLAVGVFGVSYGAPEECTGPGCLVDYETKISIPVRVKVELPSKSNQICDISQCPFDGGLTTP